ncbi:MAG: hypothetical protein GXO64_04420 [Candidatus Micrarchaeota archaeon]|nr:hypothetical protein [Candidatus Micrarchaeota archaeon]
MEREKIVVKYRGKNTFEWLYDNGREYLETYGALRNDNGLEVEGQIYEDGLEMSMTGDKESLRNGVNMLLDRGLCPKQISTPEGNDDVTKGGYEIVRELLLKNGKVLKYEKFKRKTGKLLNPFFFLKSLEFNVEVSED